MLASSSAGHDQSSGCRFISVGLLWKRYVQEKYVGSLLTEIAASGLTPFPGVLLMVDYLDGEKKSVALPWSLNFRKIGLESEGRSSIFDLPAIPCPDLCS